MADILSGIGSFASSLLDNWFAGQRQEDQQRFNAEQFASRYQTTVKDMQAAGLNPMLAYAQGGGSGASSGIASSSGSATQAFSAYQANQTQREMNAAQIDTLRTQAALNSANAAKATADARSADVDAQVKEKFGMESGGLQQDYLRGQVGSVNAEIQRILSTTSLNAAQTDVAMRQAEKIGEEIKNIPKEGERLVAAAKQLMASEALMRQQGITENNRRQLMSAQALQVAKSADLLGFDISAAESFNNLGREAGQAKPFVDVLKSVIGMFRK